MGKWSKAMMLCAVLNVAAYGQSTDDLNLSAMIQPADPTCFVRDSLYYNWCNSVVRDDDGVYHLFYSRWPKSIGFHAWLTHSEIAHATAAKPEGPYVSGKTVLTARQGYWDSITAHNVKVRKFGDAYYMYYTSTNTGDVHFSEQDLVDVAKTGYGHKHWLFIRNNQRTGVATSSTLEGPWERKDKPMVEPSGPIRTVAVNPAVCQGKDRRFYLIIKGDDAKSERRRLIQAIGTSTSLSGHSLLKTSPLLPTFPQRTFRYGLTRTDNATMPSSMCMAAISLG